jgi:hypothetical protein
MAMMNEVLMRTLWCLILGVLIALCGSSSFGEEGALRAQIEKIRRSASTSEQVDRGIIRKQLLTLLSENANPQSRGLIYAAIANVYSEDLTYYAEDAVHYAQEALMNQLSMMDKCDMYLCLAKAAEYQARHKQLSDAVDREKQVVPLIQGLAFVMDHLGIDKRLPPPAVGKYDVDPADPQYEEVVRLHAKQASIRDDALQQNRLLAYRDEFSRRILQLFGASLIKELAFASMVRKVVANASTAEKVILQIDRIVK